MAGWSLYYSLNVTHLTIHPHFFLEELLLLCRNKIVSVTHLAKLTVPGYFLHLFAHFLEFTFLIFHEA